MLDNTIAMAVQADAVTRVKADMVTNGKPDVEAIVAALIAAHGVSEDDARVELSVVLTQAVGF